MNEKKILILLNTTFTCKKNYLASIFTSQYSYCLCNTYAEVRICTIYKALDRILLSISQFSCCPAISIRLYERKTTQNSGTPKKPAYRDSGTFRTFQSNSPLNH